MSMDAVLGGLIGSILTVLISKVFDLIQRRQDHRHHLQQKFFEKKVHVAEKATGAYYLLSGQLESLATMLRGIVRDQEDVDWSSVFDHFGGEYQRYVNMLLESDFMSMLAFPLYFDAPEEELWATDVVREVLVGFARIGGLAETANQKNEQLAVEADPERIVQMESDLEALGTELREAVEKVADSFGDVAELSKSAVMRARSEMRKFEPAA